MIVVKVIEHGNSLGISLPVQYRRHIGVVKGDYLEVDLIGDTITVRSLNAKKRKLKLGPGPSGPGSSYNRLGKRFSHGPDAPTA